jgi:hypothetical protein
MLDVLVGWPGGDWQTTLKIAGTLVVAYLLLIWLASVLWAFRDIRARSADPVSQIVGVALVTFFPLLGIALYLIVRPSETLAESYDRELEQQAIRSELGALTSCPTCYYEVQSDFVACAYCRTPLREGCRSCGKLLSLDWRYCPYCETPRPAPARAPERVRAASRYDVEETTSSMEFGTRSARPRRATTTPRPNVAGDD